jgi:hypothetical protein
MRKLGAEGEGKAAANHVHFRNIDKDEKSGYVSKSQSRLLYEKIRCYDGKMGGIAADKRKTKGIGGIAICKYRECTVSGEFSNYLPKWAAR